MSRKKQVMLNQLSVGQVEREITNQVRSFYTSQLGIRTGKIICHFFDTKLVITIENTTSRLEKYFVDHEAKSFAEEIHVKLDQLIKLEAKSILEGILGQIILDITISTAFTIDVTSITVILQEIPSVRNPEVIPKFKTQE